MGKLLLMIMVLVSINLNLLLGFDIDNLQSSLQNLDSILTMPILEVSGDKMPGWEKQVVEDYGDTEGNALPVIFLGGAKGWEAAAWTPEYFMEHFGEVGITVIAQKVFEEGFHLDKEAIYPEFILLAVNTVIRDHIDDIRLNDKNACYFIGTVYHNITKEELIKKSKSETGKNAIFLHNYLSVESQTQFPILMDKSSVGKRRVYNIFIGSNNTVTSLHNHGSNFLAQLYGRKLVTLIHPKYIDNCYCEFKPKNKGDKAVFRCVIDILKPDFEKYSDLREIEIYQTILEPGDVLYIPENWLHDIRGLSIGISVGSGF